MLENIIEVVAIIGKVVAEGDDKLACKAEEFHKNKKIKFDA